MTLKRPAFLCNYTHKMLQLPRPIGMPTGLLVDFWTTNTCQGQHCSPRTSVCRHVDHKHLPWSVLPMVAHECLLATESVN